LLWLFFKEFIVESETEAQKSVSKLGCCNSEGR
jgi:hypothetical protein